MINEDRNQAWRIKDKLVSKNGHTLKLSSILLSDNDFKKLLVEYFNESLPPMTVVWMSQLIKELAVSKFLQKILVQTTNKRFMKRFVTNNYRINYSESLLVTFFLKPEAIMKKLQLDLKKYFLSRENLDNDFNVLTKDVLVKENLERVLGSWEGFENRDFAKIFSNLKKLRHQFREGKYDLEIDIEEVYFITLDYLSRLSCAADNAVKKMSLYC